MYGVPCRALNVKRCTPRWIAMSTTERIFGGIVLCLLAHASAASASRGPSLEDVETIQQLDEMAVFSFAIMSDNKGDSPLSREPFARMVQWIQESGDSFVVGLGDHVKKGWRNDFLPFVRGNSWWHDHFYPNVADGENEYYGSGQGDWGAGGAILDEVDLRQRPGVVVRENGAEYYAAIPAESGYTVHLIQLHFPDTPTNPQLAFPEDSRAYALEALAAIDKGPKDLIVMAAHSINGDWLSAISAQQQRQIMEKADLVLSATTHRFQRNTAEGYDEHGALHINTGSITYPNGTPEGYVEVHVLEDPVRLVVQFIDATRETRQLQGPRFAFLKEIGGGVRPIDLRPLVYPAGDLIVYDDAPGQGWTLKVTRGQSDPASSAFVHTGGSSHEIGGGGTVVVEYVREDPEGIDLFGYTHLEFWINGGAASGQDPQIAGKKLGAWGVVPEADTWTKVSMPVSELPSPLRSIVIAGWVQDTFYIDDMRLVAAKAPAGVEQTAGIAGPPTGLRLCQNTPNPFNQQTTIPYALRQPGVVRLRVYNVAGRLVCTLLRGYCPAGAHSVVWDGKGDSGLDAATGVYVCRLEREGGLDQARRMVLLR